MNITMNKEKQTPATRSYEYQLHQISKQTQITVIVGGILLALSMILNFVYSAVAAEQLETTMALNQYRLGSKTLTSSVQSYAVTGNRQYYDDYMRELNEDKNRDKAWAILQGNGVKADEWAKMNQIAELSNSLVPLEEQAMAEAGAGSTATAIEAVFGDEYESTINQINSLTDDVISQIQNREKAKGSLLRIIQFLSQILFLAAFVYVVRQMFQIIKFAREDLLAPILKTSRQMSELAQGNFHSDIDLTEDETEVGKMVAAMHFMKNNLTNMIEEISYILEQMGIGNYQLSVTQDYVGEFEQIRHSLEAITISMKETLSSILMASEQIDSGSGQLSFAADELAENCTNQAAQVSDLVELVGKITADIENNAASAEESAQLATKVETALSSGNSKMQELKEAIGEISRCSEQIESIIETIQDIASQTNLLSLNAAIEAARAGEAGKGFAVVADQVKNLADESSRATSHTTKLIEATVEAVNRGISIADDTIRSMTEVIAGTQEATEKMNQIAEMLKEDVDSMHVFNDHIASVSQSVDNNAAASQETAAVSTEQKTQVETMVSMLEKFKI